MVEQLFYNGDIITMENFDDAPEAVLVRDGNIIAVGTLKDLKALTTPECQAISLQGKTLLPAFIDAHGHLSLTTRYISMADLSTAESFDDILHLLKEFRKQHNLTHGEYIFGYSYDHNFLREHAHPTRDILDQVSSEVPVVIWHTSIHMAVANTKALELMKIDADSPDPKGGIIGRYINSNIPNGYLEETAINPVYALQANITMDFEKQLYEAQMEYIRNGITTVQDGEVDYKTVRLFRKMSERGKLLLDVVAYPCFDSGCGLGNVMEENKDCIKQYKNHYKIGGYKTLLDGSPQCKSAWMREPYDNSGDYRGYPWLSDEVLAQHIKLAIEDNQQILAHCNGDAAADQYLHIYQKVLQESNNPNKFHLRPVMVHCQTVREDQLDLMKKLQMIPSFFVAHVNYWGDIHLKNLGQTRGQRISPVHSALDRELMYNFHTDTPVIQPNIFHTLWTAVNRVTRGGILCGAEQRITVYDALKAVTIHAAYAYFEEQSKGSIKPGKRADLIITDKNPLKVEVIDLKNIQVMSTYKDGELLFKL